MHFIVKLFPEIIVKSPPVRRRLTAMLRDNLVRLFATTDIPVRIHKDWEKIEVVVESEDAGVARQCTDILRRTPGIAKFSKTEVASFEQLEQIPGILPDRLYQGLDGKSFAVRVKRSGQHDFKSVDVERLVGAWVLQHQPGARVNLRDPQVLIELEIRADRVFALEQSWTGLGGYPLGSQGAVLSLLSGGFDSSVASYQMTRRGLLTHFLFFNLGGSAHELAVREVAYQLWSEYSRSHNLQFVSVDFAEVVEAIRQKAPKNYANIILKRLMLKGAEQVAQRLGLTALVTGDSLAQVSSQTLTNLGVTGSATHLPILRPLIATDKGDIIDQARMIGTADLASSIPEYCGLMAQRPTTEAKLHRVEEIEARLPEAILEQCVASARVTQVGELPGQNVEPQVPSYSVVPANASIIDIRHPEESESQPLEVDCEIRNIPFFSLQQKFAGLDNQHLHLLYCDRGLLSRLHAELLVEAGATNVGVYNPSR